MNRTNVPLLILISGIIVVLLIALTLTPGVQGSVARLLDSDNFVSFVNSSSPVTGVLNANEEQGIVSRVVDGDTIILEDGRDIRYLYVDTPETVKPNTPVQCYGPEAKKVNLALVEGKEVVLVADKELKDKYGRDLRIVFTKGSDTSDVGNSVNAQLVKKGYAKVKIYKPNDAFEDEFKQFETKAKNDVIGLWKACETTK